MALNLPAALTGPLVVDDEVVARVTLDLTLYVAGPSLQEFDFLCDLYESLCPPSRLEQYTISETPNWWSTQQPELTVLGRAASVGGVRRPYFEPVRQRIRDGRAFMSGLWDGHEIEDDDGSFSFHCTCIHQRKTGLHAFARFLLPLAEGYDTLRQFASHAADHVEFFSGHGGLTFTYNPWLLEDAFDVIYARAQRYWGVDIEHLNGTLPLARDGIKSVNWITMIGNQFRDESARVAALTQAASAPGVVVEQHTFGSLLLAGPRPVAGDQNRSDNELDPYYAVAKALEPMYMARHPDFPGERFVREANTVGWMRRLIEPDGWR